MVPGTVPANPLGFASDETTHVPFKLRVRTADSMEVTPHSEDTLERRAVGWDVAKEPNV